MIVQAIGAKERSATKNVPFYPRTSDLVIPADLARSSAGIHCVADLGADKVGICCGAMDPCLCGDDEVGDSEDKDTSHDDLAYILNFSTKSASSSFR